MMSKLYDFYFRDHRARWGAYGWVMLAAFGYGAFSAGVLRRPERQVTFELAGLVLFLTIICSAWYALRNRAPVLEADLSPHERKVLKLFLRPALACAVTVSALLLVVVSRVPLRRIEAAKVNSELSALTRGPMLSGEQAKRVATALAVATESHAALPSSTLTRVRDAIRTSVLNGPLSPTIPAAADALARYGREIEPGLIGYNPQSSQASAALWRGKAAFASSSDRMQLGAAISEFTRAVQLAGTDKGILFEALQWRALAYISMGKYDEALADAEAAQKLGALDLSVVLLVEGQTLAERNRNPDDLRRAVTLLSACAQMRPPLYADARDYHALVFSGLAQAHYELGEFSESVDNARRALAVIPLGNRAVRQDLYRLTIVSYLQLGNSEEALRTSVEFEQGVGGPEASRLREILESNRSDPRRALQIIGPP